MAQAELDLWATRFRDGGAASALAPNSEWAGAALLWIGALPRGHEFTADQLADAVGDPTSSGVSGAVFRIAQGNGLVIGCGYEPSKRLRNRKRVVARWKRT